MKKLKYRIIRILDWVDDKILQHRIYKICQLIGGSSWWPIETWHQTNDVDQSLVVDTEAGEWQCSCPSIKGFNQSINPKYVSACVRCGDKRPNLQERQMGDTIIKHLFCCFESNEQGSSYIRSWCGKSIGPCVIVVEASLANCGTCLSNHQNKTFPESKW